MYRLMPQPHRHTLLLIGLATASLSCSHTEAPPAPVVASAGVQPAAHSATTKREVAVLAGGCFWGMEELLRQLPGVTNTVAGYAGGDLKQPGYKDVSSGTSGHAESVMVEFDPTETSFEAILLYFYKIHDPTTDNRQGNDVGTQYRSAIFAQSDEQLKIAKRVKQRVAAAGAWKGPITTQIVLGAQFFPAEDYHQDYLQKHPGGYTCHFERDLTL